MILLLVIIAILMALYFVMNKDSLEVLATMLAIKALVFLSFLFSSYLIFFIAAVAFRLIKAV